MNLNDNDNDDDRMETINIERRRKRKTTTKTMMKRRKDQKLSSEKNDDQRRWKKQPQRAINQMYKYKICKSQNAYDELISVVFSDHSRINPSISFIRFILSSFLFLPLILFKRNMFVIIFDEKQMESYAGFLKDPLVPVRLVG